MVVVDRIKKVYTDLISQSEDAFANRDQMNGLYEFLHQLFPHIKIRTFDSRHLDGVNYSFHEFLNEYGLNPNAEAVLIGDTIYTSKNLRDADILLEEFLHPLIEIIYNDKREFFNNFLDEAKKLFSRLDKQIQDSYPDRNGFNQEVRDKELVTQALARYFRESLGEKKTRHNTFKYFVTKFLRYIEDIFGHLVPPSLNKRNGIHIVSIDNITNVYGLRDLADALNTKGITIDVRKGFKRSETYHVTSNFDESKYDTERLDEHRVAIYKR